MEPLHKLPISVYRPALNKPPLQKRFKTVRQIGIGRNEKRTKPFGGFVLFCQGLFANLQLPIFNCQVSIGKVGFCRIAISKQCLAKF